MEQPKYSIIVPVYKTEAYIRQCVNSILAQTYDRFEVVLVDDGSPDGCGAICDEYAAQDGRFRVVHKENGGLVSARKAGAEVCTGDYVINVDSDDYIADDLLECLTKIIAEHEPDVVCYDAYRFSADECEELNGLVPRGFYKGKEIKTIHESLILNEDHKPAIRFMIWGKAVKREIYLRFQMPVPNKISRGEDLAVTAPLLAQCESVYISDIHGYYYRDNPSSIMHTFKKDEPQQILWVAEYLRTAMGTAYQSKIDAFVLVSYFDFLGRLMHNCSNYREFRETQMNLWKEEIEKYTRCVRCKSRETKTRVTSFLMSRRCYGLIWFIRKVKQALRSGLGLKMEG